MVLPPPTVPNAPSHQRTGSAQSHVLALNEDELCVAAHWRRLSFQLQLDDYAGPDSPPLPHEPLAVLPDFPLVAPSSPFGAGPFADSEAPYERRTTPEGELAQAFIRRRPSSGPTHAVVPALLTPGFGDTLDAATFWGGGEPVLRGQSVTSLTGRQSPFPPPTAEATDKTRPESEAQAFVGGSPQSLSAALAAVELTEHVLPAADVGDTTGPRGSFNRPPTSSPSVTRPPETLMDRVLNARPAVAEPESEPEAEAGPGPASADEVFADAPDDDTAPAGPPVPSAVRPRPLRVRFLSQPQILGASTSAPPPRTLQPAPVHLRPANDVAHTSAMERGVAGLAIWWPQGPPRGYPQAADFVPADATAALHPSCAPTQATQAFFPQRSPVTRTITPLDPYVGPNAPVQPPASALPRAHNAAAQALEPAFAPGERPCLGPCCRPATSPPALVCTPSAASPGTSGPGDYFGRPPPANAFGAAPLGQAPRTPSPRRLEAQQILGTPPQYLGAAPHAGAPTPPARRQQPTQRSAPSPGAPSRELFDPNSPRDATTTATYQAFWTASAATSAGGAPPPPAPVPHMFLNVSAFGARTPSPRGPAPHASPGKRRRDAADRDALAPGAAPTIREAYTLGAPELGPSPKRVRPTPPHTPSAVGQRPTVQSDFTPTAWAKLDRRPRAGSDLGNAAGTAWSGFSPQTAAAPERASVGVASEAAAHLARRQVLALRAPLALLPWRALADGGAAALVPPGTALQVRRAACNAWSNGVAAGLEFRQTAQHAAIYVLNEPATLNGWLQDVGLPAIWVTLASPEERQAFALARLQAR